MALGSLRANKLQSCLTMLGIVIRNAAVIAVVGLGLGAQRSVDNRPSRLGTRRFRVFGNDPLNDIYMLATSEADVPLAMAEIQTVLRRSHRVKVEAPDDFRIRNQVDALSVAGDTAETARCGGASSRLGVARARVH